MRVNLVRLKLLLMTIGLGCSSFAYAAGGNRNPATVEYVDQAIARVVPGVIYTAGSGVTIQNNIISTTPFLSIGDLYQGGIVFYLDDTGRHGLAINLEDSSTFANFSTNTTTINAFSSGIGAGIINTANILATLTASGNANTGTNNGFILVNQIAVEADGITSCAPGGSSTLPPLSPTSTCFGGWYVGSAYELQLIFLNFETLNQAIVNASGTAISTLGNYWSSTMQFGTNNAYSMHLSTGEGLAVLMTNSDSVRGIRQF